MDSDTESSPPSSQPPPQPPPRAKRAHGTGRIRRKTLRSGATLWEGSIMVGTRYVPGCGGGLVPKPDMRYVTARTRREVEAKLGAIAQQRRTAGLPAARAQRMTLGELLDEWLQQGQARGLKPATIATYRLAIRHILLTLGAVRLVELEPRHSDQLQSALRDKGLAPSRVVLIATVFRSAVKMAVARGLLVRTPLLGAAPMPRRIGTKRALSREQVASLLQATAGDALYGPAIELLLFTGLRNGELRRLRWPEVDGARGELRIADSKTPAGYRLVPLNAGARAALERQRRAQAQRGVAPDIDAVITGRTGRAIQKTQLDRAFRRLADAAGLPADYTPHTLRRTYMTAAARARVNPATTQRLVGHASPDVALSIYTDVTDEDARRAAADIDRELRGPPQERQ